MTELVERLSSSSDVEDPLSRLTSSFLIGRGSKEQLSKERLADLIGRAKLGDIDGLAVEAQLSNTEALRFARSLYFLEQGLDAQASFSRVTRTPLQPQAVTTRQLLRTPDARKLAKELLAIFAKEASSKFASNRFLFLLSPTIDEKVLRRRFEICLGGRDVFNELQSKGKLDEVRKLLSALSLSQEKPGRVGGDTKRSAASKESDVIRYFASRRRMIEIADSFLADFSEIKTLTAFLRLGKEENENVSTSSEAAPNSSTKKLLTQILKDLKEVEALSVPDAEGVVSDAEIAVNDELRSKRRSVDRERVKQLIENQVVEISSTLGMNRQEEDDFMKAVFEGLTSSPASSSFEFDRRRLRVVLNGWRERRVEELEQRLEKVESSLRGFIEETDGLLQRLVLLDQMLATSSLMEKYSLVVPTILRKNAAISFKKGLSLFLLQKDERKEEGEKQGVKSDSKTATLQLGSAVEPVSYSIGITTSKAGAGTAAGEEAFPARNVVMLTGANSGGKTTLLTTLASIHILSLYGLPVPCESAEISPMPIYLFRRRMTKKIGSLEQALRSLIPVFASDDKGDRRNLVLIDEFEALTEPGAAGRIIATMMNKAALSSNLVLLVTHLARETLPHIKLPIRVDGIEASGFDPTTEELVVDRQPKFNHIGSSSPQHIVNKLSKQSSAKSSVRALYAEILEALGSDSSVPVQTPLFFPWMASSGESG